MDAPHPPLALAQRRVAMRTRGRGHGGVTRLMSPPDLGEHLKPFVFLDLFEADASAAGSLPLHPHSGIATVTVITQGSMRFDDPKDGAGLIGYGGVEWMRAGGGVWHGKEMSAGDSARVQGFQLWTSLPPELENGPVDSQYLEASQIPEAGPARVILGSYGGQDSPVRSPAGITYLLVTLRPGERWSFQPSEGQDVAWLAVAKGMLVGGAEAASGELIAFEEGSAPIPLEAGVDGEAIFVLGSAAPHPHELVLGYYSVHTSRQALAKGEANIEAIGDRLRAASAGSRKGPVPIFQ